MSTTEKTGLLTYIDKSGNKYLLYPVTKAEAVDGLEELLAQKAPASHVTDKNNPHGVTAEQVGARPSNWVPTASEVGAAPSGYGWGEYAVNAPNNNVDDIPNITHTFYASNGNPVQGIWLGQYTAINNVTGFLTMKALTGPVGSVLTRLRIDNVWQPWEWENPPMSEGAEDITTERYHGKPVWVRSVSLNLAGAGNKYVSVTGYNVIDEVVSFTTYMQNGIYANDMAFNSNIIDCFVNVDSGSFFVNSADMPDCTVKAIIKYTKK